MISQMNSRARLVKILGGALACAVGVACADKAFRPVTSAGSPRMQLQINTTGAKQVSATGKRQILVALAAYQSSDTSGSSDHDKGLRFLAGPVIVSVTGASQTVTLNVDLTGCLADGTRLGSQTACSMYYAVFLHDSIGYEPDTAVSTATITTERSLARSTYRRGRRPCSRRSHFPKVASAFSNGLATNRCG